ncbi:hypothetical protein XENORESO_017991 [Xenotaenia resolanae]|uniref:Uncharacterized protein n=1 Tax=Xenotaenia resolanae TaxID=208358 RepID=A0ABV0WC26_9TELE
MLDFKTFKILPFASLFLQFFVPCLIFNFAYTVTYFILTATLLPILALVSFDQTFLHFTPPVLYFNDCHVFHLTPLAAALICAVLHQMFLGSLQGVVLLCSMML